MDIIFKMSKRIGNTGIVYANDIDPAALQWIEEKCQSEKITNMKTFLGAVDDPLYPKNNLDMVVVFDCLFEFSQPVKWMQNTGKYLKPESQLVIEVDDSFLKSHMIIVLQPIHQK